MFIIKRTVPSTVPHPSKLPRRFRLTNARHQVSCCLAGTTGQWWWGRDGVRCGWGCYLMESRHPDRNDSIHCHCHLRSSAAPNAPAGLIVSHQTYSALNCSPSPGDRNDSIEAMRRQDCNCLSSNVQHCPQLFPILPNCPASGFRLTNARGIRRETPASQLLPRRNYGTVVVGTGWSALRLGLWPHPTSCAINGGLI